MRTLATPARIVALLVALVAVWTWQGLASRENEQAHRAAYARFGEALLRAAEGATWRSSRGGWYAPEELAETLEEVRAELDAHRIAVVDATGRAFAEAGAAAGGERFEKVYEPSHPRGGGPGGRGRGPRARGGSGGSGADLRAMPEGALTIVLELPRDSLDRELARDRGRMLVTGSALSVAILALFVLVALRERSLELGASLESSRERVTALEYLGRLGAGLAHETRNPLGVVRGFAQKLVRDPGDGAQVERAGRTILEETDRTLARLDEFLLLSRPRAPELRTLPLLPFLRRLAELVAPDVEARRAQLRIGGEEARIEADEEQARRLFLNLLLNAVQAVEEGGTVEASVERGPEGLRVCVVDDGPGVPTEIRAHLFEPYVTRREGGSGLGLAIARQIAERHGWKLDYVPHDGRGTTMCVRIPGDARGETTP